ncbi:M15 family metallopeptidase, partial [Acetonema longum]
QATIDALKYCVVNDIKYQDLLLEPGSPLDPISRDYTINGRLDVSTLTRIPSAEEEDATLASSTAVCWAYLVQAAAHEDPTLNINGFQSSGSAEGYRDLATQIKYDSDKGGDRDLVAEPGRSNHGWGNAIDFWIDNGSREHQWLKNNAYRFGFKPYWREHWHWDFSYIPDFLK